MSDFEFFDFNDCKKKQKIKNKKQMCLKNLFRNLMLINYCLKN